MKKKETKVISLQDHQLNKLMEETQKKLDSALDTHAQKHGLPLEVDYLNPAMAHELRLCSQQYINCPRISLKRWLYGIQTAAMQGKTYVRASGVAFSDWITEEETIQALKDLGFKVRVSDNIRVDW